MDQAEKPLDGMSDDYPFPVRTDASAGLSEWAKSAAERIRLAEMGCIFLGSELIIHPKAAARKILRLMEHPTNE
jgi:hypothetical protein